MTVNRRYPGGNRDVRGKAYFERDSACLYFPHQRLVVQNAYAMADSLGTQRAYRPTDALGTAGLSGMRYGVQSAIHRGMKNLRELLGRILFITTESKSHHSQVAVAQSGAQRLPGKFRRLAAPVIDDDSALDAKCLLALGKAFQHGFQRHVPITEPRAVCSEREGDLRIPYALRSLILAQLECNAPEVLFVLQTRSNRSILQIEVGEIAKAISVLGACRQLEPMPVGYLGEGTGPDRALQMHMQVCFR